MPIAWLFGFGLAVGLIALASRYGVDRPIEPDDKEPEDDAMKKSDALLVPQPKMSEFDLTFLREAGTYPIDDYKGRIAIATSNGFEPGHHHGCDVMHLRRKRGTKNGPLPGYPGKVYFMVSPEIPIMIRSILPGKVTNVYQKPGGGLSITIDHGEVPGIGPLKTFYQHCHVALVKKGETVFAGTAIAIVGRSGTDTNHLHFEIWLINRRYKNPRTGATKSNSNIWAINPAPFLAVLKHTDSGYADTPVA